MSPEAQRIAIAEACWCVASTCTVCGEPGYVAKSPSGETHWDAASTLRSAALLRAIPDYLSDLNAMHEAEKVLFATDGAMARRIYGGYLVSLTNAKLGKIFEPSRLDWWHSQHATAAQRAEAFLRTIGKWEESS